jgi:predicted nucleic acid binding AN1-type Zn finger protein
MLNYLLINNIRQYKTMATKKSSKCAFCMKFSSLMVDCKCHNKYCHKHMLPEVHKCVKLCDFKKEAFDKNKDILMDGVILKYTNILF